MILLWVLRWSFAGVLHGTVLIVLVGLVGSILSDAVFFNIN